MSKKECKRKYKNGEIFLGEALECLMFIYGMDRGDAINYLQT